MKLIFAQGNPEPEYALFRHNVGCLALNSIAEQLEANWTNKPKFNAMLASTTIGNEKVILVKPNSYYNETGASARKLVDFYKVDPAKDLLVIHDDLALPFGTIRTRQRGSDGGNNGIKSMNLHIEQAYTRIRIGICNEFRESMDDTTFVLAKFRNAETRQLKKNVVPQVIKLIEQFCADKLEPASYKTLE